ncbi:MAG: hypothetical protein H4O13_12700 [Xanthomonadales bacterium]|nr:hypothetical protein [Xanthomonadales bacterium]
MTMRILMMLLTCSVLVAAGLLVRLGSGSSSEANAIAEHAAPQLSGDVAKSSMASSLTSGDVESDEAPVLSSEAGSAASLESEFTEIEALAAGGDEEAITQLGALMRSCGGVLGNQYTGERSERFEHPAWRPWREACSFERSLRWTKLLRAAPPPSSPDIDAFSALPVNTDDPDELAARDRVLEELLARTDDVELAASAAWLYADRSRQLAFANGELPNSLFLAEGSEALRTDVAIAFACRVGRDCSPFSQLTIAECAMTAGCTPGASMQQIMTMRRSPQELQLIDTMLGRLLELRRGRG